ncbi:MAG: hypothetical protein HXL38_002845 [Candidatus Saccharimonas sp.]|nr:MAG: hypothetical protein HXL38_002845 [Candidatus Saccharimonas sp.]
MLALLERGISMVKKIFIAGVVILSLLGFSSVAKADTRDVTFHLDNSLAGSTFFHQNVIVSNLFDAVPSYNGPQQWRDFSTRRLRVNRGTTVQVSGVFYYRTIFGKINMGRFTRNVYVPHDAVAVTVK